jgi:hypothetical protein
MACITRIQGYGANPQTGISNDTFYDLTYQGRCTLAQSPAFATGTLTPRYPDGSFHPDHVFSSVSSITYEGCDPLEPNQRNDCVNGSCLPLTIYGTPGVFASLAACQSGCAQNSNCTGECVDPTEIAGLRQALNNLQSKFCR